MSGETPHTSGVAWILIASLVTSLQAAGPGAGELLQTASSTPPPIREGLVIRIAAEPPSGPEVKVSQELGRKGPTSVRYRTGDPKQAESVNPTDPHGGKFYVKDRDLGQTFTAPHGKPIRLEAVTVRVGPASADSDGALSDARERGAMFLQIFEVSGTAQVHDNGTTGDLQVSHGYKNPGTRAMGDDYITGERYTTLLVFRGGSLPASFTLGKGNTHMPTRQSTGSILRFDISGAGGVTLQPGQRYAFLIGFEQAGPTMALPLDNWDYLNQERPRPTEAELQNGPYAGGHAIRREGRVPDPWKNKDLVFSEDPSYSRFAESFADRLKQEPGTFGRPDVDTYRDLVFWISGTDLE